MSLRSVRTDVDGLTWHHQEGGPREADAVVLVHGLSVASDYMAPTAELLAARGFRVLAPDIPGFGLSDAPSEPLTVPDMARALAGWMDAIGVPRAHFVANSLGCQVVAALAMDAPRRADRLVLIGPNAEADAKPLKLAAGLVKDAFRERPKLLWIHARDDLRAGVRRIWHAARSAMEHDIYRWAPAVRHPTLVLRGMHDPLFSAADARRIARRMPNAIVAELPGAPHAANYSAPEAVVEAALPFLERRHPAFPPSIGRPLSPAPRQA